MKINPSDYEGHTSGPWKYRRDTLYGQKQLVEALLGPSGEIVFYVSGYSGDNFIGINSDNQKLIADAPAILAALVESQVSLGKSETWRKANLEHNQQLRAELERMKAEIKEKSTSAAIAVCNALGKPEGELRDKIDCIIYTALLTPSSPTGATEDKKGREKK